MKKILLLLIFTFSLFAQNTNFLENPKVYSAVGDEIYNNVYKIEKLKEIDNFKSYKFKIDNYISDVRDAKEFGFAVESGQKADLKLVYLKKIRELLKVNNYFKRDVYKVFNLSISEEKNDLFTKIINSGLLDIKKNKIKIMDYYIAHSDEVDTSGVIEYFLKEDAKNKKQYIKNYKKYKQEQKIKRVRASDKYKQKKLEKELTQKVVDRKEQIREYIKRELSN